MNACPKCAMADLSIRFTSKGSITNHSGLQQIEDEFLTSARYEFYWQHKSAKDHLLKICRTCQYQWRENTADAEGANQ